MINKAEVLKKWLEKLKPKRSKKKHNCRHFDNKIKDYEKFLPLVSNPVEVAKHSFLPFVQFVKRKYKYGKKNEKGKRTLIKSENGRLKVREIMYAGHLDTLVYVWYQCILEKYYEEQLANFNLSNDILAYRRIEKETDYRGKCNIDFSYEIFSYIKEKDTECIALTFDIKNFFPSLSHYILKEKWSEMLGEIRLPPDHFNVFKSLTKYTFIDIGQNDVKKLLNINTQGKKAHAKNFLENKKFSGTKFRKLKKKIRKLENEAKKNILIKNLKDKGIPQGSPLSGLLANIYLIDFDKKISKMVGDAGGIYRRYCDDIIVICQNDLAIELEKEIREKISINKDSEGNAYLIINDSKTKRINFIKESNRLSAWKVNKELKKQHLESLQYLGFEFDGMNIFIRSGSIARFHNQIRYGIAKIKKVYREGILLKRKFYERYSPMGNSNFFNYARKAKNTVLNNKFYGQLRNILDKVQSI